MTYFSNNWQDAGYSIGSERSFDSKYSHKPATSVEFFPIKKSVGNIILGALSGEDFLRIARASNRISLAEGESLYQPGDKIDYIYFPETAVASQFCILEDGRTVEIATIGKEGITGQRAIFGSQTAVYWTQVSIAGKALKISSEIVRREFSRCETLQMLLLNYLNQYTMQISNRVICNNYHLLEKRFCSWLLMLCDRHGSDTLTLTHSQIAGYLGVHRPSFTHVAKKLREKKIIDYCRGNLSILKRSELLRHACECYTSIG
ncbi:MAG: Crp/Fnr family transcriptional regulator [Acidobacteriota bacterium]|nr:Crp/Fnr family transcriptional regulator [Acidobacteriota bacterium]